MNSDEVFYKLQALQKIVATQIGRKVDVYRQEGKGVIVVEHGKPLHPLNVLYIMPDWQLEKH